MPVTITLPNEDEILDDGSVLFLERTVNTGGGIWRVHKNDADDVWPSDLHAHNLESPNEKLDVYTGEVYDTKSKKMIYKLKPKQMRYLYDKLSTCKEVEITAKCVGDNTANFTYLPKGTGS